ncbi:MAG TPA: hypothetical protein VHK63_07385 [Candidatus Limnocylindria bacterium]|nr:hypothetical protein [Candidatus Limnocylindria bacterium]
MTRRFLLAMVSGAVLALLIALPVAAGGWATVSVEDGGPTEGGGTTVGITLLQHGVTPVDFGEVAILAVNEQTGERITATGHPVNDDDGRPTAWFELPAGAWTITARHTELDLGGGEDMSVTFAAPRAAGQPVPPTETAATPGMSPALLLAACALLFVAVGVGVLGVVLSRRHQPSAAPATSASANAIRTT